MGKRAFLTPDTLAGDLVCFPLYIPSHLFHYAVGALGELAESYNWESFGAVAPAVAAEYFDERLLNFVKALGCDMELQRFWASYDSLVELDSNAHTQIPFNQRQSNPSYYDMDLGTSEVTLINAGLYFYTIKAAFEQSSTGIRRVRLQHDSKSFSAQSPPHAASVITVEMTGSVNVNANTVLTFTVFQNSGSGLDLVGNNAVIGPIELTIFPLLIVT